MERGRFAPTPSGRLHMGNIFAALLAWLDVRSCGGRMLLRVEDLDIGRCSREKAELLLEDLRWLGLDWDEGGLCPEYCQSERTVHYEAALEELSAQGLVYPCFCTRAERLAASAPHLADGGAVHRCDCAYLSASAAAARQAAGERFALRVRVPDEQICFVDGHYGEYGENLAADCGDFILRRSDGVFAYQLAVVVDDALMGVSRVVRGRDLLSSTPRQIWLAQRLGYTPPVFAHVPLLLAADGKRLAKRERSLDMGALQERYSAAQIIGLAAFWAGLQDSPQPVHLQELVADFDWAKVCREDVFVEDFFA